MSSEASARSTNTGNFYGELLETLSSNNSMRNNLDYTFEDLLSIYILSNISNISSIINGYNKAVEFIRDFASVNERIQKSGYIRVNIQVKVIVEGVVMYYDRSHYEPSEFIKNKNKHIYIAIRGEKEAEKINDLILLPFMVGCKWCKTYKKNPKALHNMGEDASSFGGYFLIEGAMKFFLAQEKVAHNMIFTTLKSVSAVASENIETTLKIQDNKNNSVEMTIYRQKEKYYIKTSAFKIRFELTKLFKQIYLFIKNPSDRTMLKKLNSCMSSIETYDKFMNDIIDFTAGNMKNYVIFDFQNTEEKPITTLEETMEEARKSLFPNDEIGKAYLTGKTDIDGVDKFPYIVIESLFPSVENYEKKAFLLMKMLVQQLFTEQKIIKVSNRNDVGYKFYATPGEVLKIEITKDDGGRFHNNNGVFKPKTTASTGSNNVFETLSSDNIFGTLSQITTLSTPMSEHSRTTDVRSVNETHVGYKCLFETPSGSKVGLVTHMATHCCVSTTKKKEDIYDIILNVLENSTGRRQTKTKKNEKTVSVNSLPYTTVDNKEFIEIKNRIKRNVDFMDVAIVSEFYEFEGKVQISSYNIYCDGGRLYRPLYNVEGLLEYGLIKTAKNGPKTQEDEDRAINNFIKENTFENLVKKGIIEMVFAVELKTIVISEHRKNIDPSLHNYSEINPVNIYGLVSSCAPMMNHNPGGRAIHESAMAKSAQTPGSTNALSLSETSSKKLQTSEPALVTTIYNEKIANHCGSGVNAIVGILITGTNIEDAFTVNKRFAKSVMMQITTTTEIIIQQIQGVVVKQGRPPIENIVSSKYHAIDSVTGLPIIGSKLRVGDAIFAMYHITLEGTVNKTEFVEEGKEGIVTNIKTIESENTTTYRITISLFKQVDEGDKFAFRYSQKGVTGSIEKYENMPYIESGPDAGLRPDLLFSPLSLSSRATPGLNIELLLGVYAALTGQSINATAFNITIDEIERIKNELNNDTNFKHVETFIDPKSGERIKIMYGVCYTRILKHTSRDKQKACSHLRYTIEKSTRQPSRGGTNGALRDGFMELNTTAAHSAVHLINSIYKKQSDAIAIYVCEKCGHLNDRFNSNNQICTKCMTTSVVRIESTYAIVMLHHWLLAAGIKFNMFPRKIK